MILHVVPALKALQGQGVPPLEGSYMSTLIQWKKKERNERWIDREIR